ncbi:MAG TPA: translation elongation factor Ts [Armatimonadota bacterium]|jgi:elongation factor Ts
MAITAAQVKELREETGAGMMDCKKALSMADGNKEEARKWLREKGLAAAAKRSARTAKEGTIGSYIHPVGRKIGVMVELNCETDFVAKNEEFQQMARDLAMHVAAAKPEYVRREDLPEALLAQELEINLQLARNEGKPEAAVQKIAEGRLNKRLAELCLMDQPFVKSPEGRTVREVLNDLIAKIGEKIDVARFVAFRVGEGAAEEAAEGEAEG